MVRMHNLLHWRDTGAIELVTASKGKFLSEHDAMKGGMCYGPVLNNPDFTTAFSDFRRDRLLVTYASNRRFLVKFSDGSCSSSTKTCLKMLQVR